MSDYELDESLDHVLYELLHEELSKDELLEDELDEEVLDVELLEDELDDELLEEELLDSWHRRDLRHFLHVRLHAGMRPRMYVRCVQRRESLRDALSLSE